MFAQELIALRHSTGLSQQQFADYTGVSYHSIRAYEIGRPIPRLVAELLQLRVQMLQENAEEEEKRLNESLHQHAAEGIRL